MQALSRTTAAACISRAASLVEQPRMPALSNTGSFLRPCKVHRVFKPSYAPAKAHRSISRPTFAAQAAPSTPQVSTREEQAGPSRLRLHVTVPAQQVSATYKKTLAEFRKEVRVSGFRKGKAPDASVIAEVGGQRRFNSTVLATVLEQAMKQGMAPYDDRIIDDSDSVDQEGAELEARFDPGKDLEFSVSFDVMPELRWKSPYKEIKVEVDAAGDEASDAAAVESKVQGLRQEGAELRVVSGRGMQMGDIAIIDIDILSPSGGESLVGGPREGFRLDTSHSDETFIPGVAGILEGMAVGEHRAAPLSMPDRPDFQPASLRGQDTQVSLTLKELFQAQLPELSDSWAEGVFPGCGCLEGLREQLTAQQKAETDAKTQKAIEDAVLEAVAAAVDCPVPDALVAQLGQQMYQVKLQEALQGGQLSMEVVQQLATEQLLLNYIKENRSELESTQRGLMAVQAIMQEEGIGITQQEVQAEFAAAVAGFEQYDQEFDRDKLREQVEQQLEGRKAMDWLLANLDIKVLPAKSAARQ